MEDVKNVIARLALRKAAVETEDPLAVFLMREEMPAVQPGMRVSAYTEQEGGHWKACLLFFNAEEGCCFYKHCLRRKCKSEFEAQLIAEYSQDKTSIDCPLATQTPLKTKFSQN